MHMRRDSAFGYACFAGYIRDVVPVCLGYRGAPGMSGGLVRFARVRCYVRAQVWPHGAVVQGHELKEGEHVLRAVEVKGRQVGRRMDRGGEVRHGGKMGAIALRLSLCPLHDMDWLPAHVLPKWLLLVGVIAALNGVQNTLRPVFSHKVYASREGVRQATPLAARLFGLWNVTSAMVRVYAAYHMSERGAYILCLGTFVIACYHFVSEMLFFGTLATAAGSISPILVASSSIVAMVSQYSYYVGK